MPRSAGKTAEQSEDISPCSPDIRSRRLRSLAFAVTAGCSKEAAVAAPPSAQTDAEIRTPEKIANFTLIDQTGASHELYKMTDAKAIVITMQGVGCPIVQKMTPDLKAVQAAYEGKGVKFFMLNANNQDTRETIAAEAANFEHQDADPEGRRTESGRAAWRSAHRRDFRHRPEVPGRSSITARSTTG